MWSRFARDHTSMPMIPEAVIAMLATARLGAIHSVVFGGFASPELAARIDDAKPKVVLTASCGIEPGRLVPYKPLVDYALDIAKHKPARCVVYQRSMMRAELKTGRDLDWDEIVSNAPSHGSLRPSLQPADGRSDPCTSPTSQ